MSSTRLPPQGYPELIVFDVDGVLVDVRGSFHRTTLQTVTFFTGKRVTLGQLQEWKNRSGFNDDWTLSTAWVQSLGANVQYEEVKHKFVELYWGDYSPGNVQREKWLLPIATLARISSHAELAIFTGRTRRELDYTLESCGARKFFREIITVEDVERPKPDPEGLLKILKGRDSSRAIYVGDSVDDAIASGRAKMPFVGVLFGRGKARRHRANLLTELGARAVITKVTNLERWITKNSRQ